MSNKEIKKLEFKYAILTYPNDYCGVLNNELIKKH